MSEVQIILNRDVYLDNVVTPIPLVNPIYAGDAGAQRIRFRVYQKHGNVATLDLSECTITAHFIRPDDGDVVITGVGGTEYSYVDLPAACYVYPGIFKLLIRAAYNGVTTSIMYITGRIDEPTTDTIIDPGTTIPSLDELLAQIDACEDATTAANTAATNANGLAGMIAPVYDPESTYAVGDYCVYSGVMYQCNTAIETAEAWTAAHWTATSAGDAISQLSTDLEDGRIALFNATNTGVSDVTEDIYQLDEPTWTQGSWTSSGESASDYWITTGLIDGDFILKNDNTDYGYIVGKFTSAGAFSSYVIGGSGLCDDKYIYVPSAGSGYKVRVRSRHMTNSTQLYAPADVTADLFRPTGVVSGIYGAIKYDPYINSYAANYSNVLANISGCEPCIFNATSVWTDLPFAGMCINAQYTTNYDCQIMFGLAVNRIAYRFVNRTTHAPYNAWQELNGNSLRGKTASIVGDSRSSYSGTVPSGNAFYYPKSTGSVLTSLSQMWWKIVLDYFGMSLVVNDSYSGGYVANYDGNNGANTLSSDTAIANLGTTAPDIVFVFAGVNDWNNNQVSIGTYDGTQAFPTTNTSFREAYALMISKIQAKFPDAEIWCCTNPYCCPAGTGSTCAEMPVPIAGSGGTSLNAFNNAIKEIATLLGCHVIDFAACGTTWQNLTDYTGDYDTDNGLHYNAAGHALLAATAINTLKAYA